VGEMLEAGEYGNKLSLFSLITGSRLSVSSVMMLWWRRESELRSYHNNKDSRCLSFAFSQRFASIRRRYTVRLKAQGTSCPPSLLEDCRRVLLAAAILIVEICRLEECEECGKVRDRDRDRDDDPHRDFPCYPCISKLRSWSLSSIIMR